MSFPTCSANVQFRMPRNNQVVDTSLTDECVKVGQQIFQASAYAKGLHTPVEGCDILIRKEDSRGNVREYSMHQTSLKNDFTPDKIESFMKCAAFAQDIKGLQFCAQRLPLSIYPVSKGWFS